MFFDVSDRQNTVFNGATVQGLNGKSPSSINVTQPLAVNQPVDGGTDIDCFDASNEKWLDGGSNYIFSDSSHSGLSMMFLTKHPSSFDARFVYDFGGYGGTGYGLNYNTIRYEGYTPVNHGGAGSLNNSLSSPTTDWVVLSMIVEFGVVQKIFRNLQEEAQSAISGLSKLDSSVMSDASTRNSNGGPVCLGTQCKSPAGNRRYLGRIKNAIVCDEAWSDYQHRLYYMYQRNKILV